MTTAVLVNDDEDSAALIRWAYRFAQARATDPMILHKERRSGQSQRSEITLTASSNGKTTAVGITLALGATVALALAYSLCG